MHSSRASFVLALSLLAPAGGGSFVISLSERVNLQTGVTYAFAAVDRGTLLSFSNAAPIAATIAQAGATFPNGWYVDVQNRGVGTLTITVASTEDELHWRSPVMSTIADAQWAAPDASGITAEPDAEELPALEPDAPEPVKAKKAKKK